MRCALVAQCFGTASQTEELPVGRCNRTNSPRYLKDQSISYWVTTPYLQINDMQKGQQITRVSIALYTVCKSNAPVQLS
jgi:hypothetical protein